MRCLCGGASFVNLLLGTSPSGEINFSQFAKAWKIEKNDLGIIGRFFSQVDADKSSGGEDSVYFQEWAVSFSCVFSCRLL
jgi:hypothetical protein